MLYPLVQKSDSCNALLKFRLQVENLFDSKIKNLQTDGGTEYFPFKPILEADSIVHLVLCPYTPEQNGTTERKHRHVVETCLPLLPHVSMLSYYWDEAFQTTISYKQATIT